MFYVFVLRLFNFFTLKLLSMFQNFQTHFKNLTAFFGVSDYFKTCIEGLNLSESRNEPRVCNL